MPHHDPLRFMGGPEAPRYFYGILTPNAKLKCYFQNEWPVLLKNNKAIAKAMGLSRSKETGRCDS